MQATVVRSWHDGVHAHAAIATPETQIVDGKETNVVIEHIVRVPLHDAEGVRKDDGEVRDALVQAHAEKRKKKQHQPFPFEGTFEV